MIRLIFIAVLGLSLSGCDLFSTRTPEPPTTGSGFIPTPASTISILLQNFTGTLAALDAQNYLHVFISPNDSTGSGSKTYTFRPAESQSVFVVWSPQSEQNWLSNLSHQLPSGSRLLVSLTNQTIDQSSSPATFSADYSISIPVPSSSLIPGVVQGSLQMQMLLVTTSEGTKEWRILSWTDVASKTGNSPSWTDLKVKLS